MMLIFRIKYFIAFLILLIIELYIALNIQDQFIRPYLGDVLVVILIYSFLMSFIRLSYKKAIVFVLIFSFTVEISQYFHLIEVLNLRQCQVAHWVLGSSFNWWDFLAYSIGLAIAFVVESKNPKINSDHNRYSKNKKQDD
jgi:hypothetical protein